MRWPRLASVAWLGLATVAAVVLGFGIAQASIPSPTGQINGCYKNSNGDLIVIDSTASCPSGYTALNWSQGLPPGTIYDAVSVVGSYLHDQANPDKIIYCPNDRVVISAWAMADNDIPLPVIINNSSQFTSYIEIRVAGGGTGPWPVAYGQLAQDNIVWHGVICARVSS